MHTCEIKFSYSLIMIKLYRGRAWVTWWVDWTAIWGREEGKEGEEKKE